MTLLDSIYINNSGGKILLDYLIKNLYEKKLDVFYLLDFRCKGDYPFLPESNVCYLPSSIKERHRFYKKNKDKFSSVFCFGNVPPTIKLKVPVYTYVHNPHLVEYASEYPIKRKIVYFAKSLFIKALKNNTDSFIVQSENMKKLLTKAFNVSDSRCLIIPFYRHLNVDTPFSMKENEFVYVSNGNPHKNHLNLLKAWEILYKDNIQVKLHLTVPPEHQNIVSLINEYKEKNIPVINHGYINVNTLFSRCKYSIYPSLAESFGLGLVEAIEANTEVIASDLPFVHTVVSPLKVFNPLSPESIALAVKDTLLAENKSGQVISRAKISDEVDKLINLITCAG